MSSPVRAHPPSLTDLPLEPGESPRYYRLVESKPFLGLFGGYRREQAVTSHRWISREGDGAPVNVRIDDIEAVDGSVGSGFMIPDIAGDGGWVLLPLCMLILAPFYLGWWVYDQLTRGQLPRTDWAYWKDVRKTKIKVKGEFFRKVIRGSLASDVGHALALAMAERRR